jgi:hypothetical protein
MLAPELVVLGWRDAAVSTAMLHGSVDITRGHGTDVAFERGHVGRVGLGVLRGRRSA